MPGIILREGNTAVTTAEENGGDGKKKAQICDYEQNVTEEVKVA